jgi:hypothetical protein
MFDMIMAVALSLRMKILAKMVKSSDLLDELFNHLFKTTPDQEALAVAPVVGATQTVVTQPTCLNPPFLTLTATAARFAKAVAGG